MRTMDKFVYLKCSFGSGIAPERTTPAVGQWEPPCFPRKPQRKDQAGNPPVPAQSSGHMK